MFAYTCVVDVIQIPNRLLIISGADQFSSDRRGTNFPGGGGGRGATKDLTRLCSPSATVVGYD